MQPITPPKSLMEVTAENIRKAIVTGELPLGSKLSEQRLADILGVSRSPVRDALAALQSEGLVTISPKRGSFVFTPNLRVVDELCEHRKILETAALRMGTTRNHSELLERITAAHAKMQKAQQAKDPLAYALGDTEFHLAIVESASNRSVVKSYNLTVSPLKALRTHLFTIMSENTARSVAEHEAIVRAVAAKDIERAVAMLGTHIGHLSAAFRVKMEKDGGTMPAAQKASTPA